MDPRSLTDLRTAADELVSIVTKHHIPDSFSPTAQALALLVVIIVTCYVAGFASGNYSQVDKLWSITPWLYVWIWALNAIGDARLLLMAFVSTMWGIRLTLNFNRRGGYTWPPWLGDEDYRWAYVRKRFQQAEHPWRFEIFHLGFICIFQNVLLFWIAAPAQVVYAARGTAAPVGIADLILTCAILGLIGLEGVSDQEQFDFQEEKYALLNLGVPKENLPVPFDDGFLHDGVFAWSRHPNYFAEQSIWVLMNLYPVLAAGGAFELNWAMGGVLVLIALFQGSIDLMETITKAKWPRYHKYIEQVPQLLPYGRGIKDED